MLTKKNIMKALLITIGVVVIIYIALIIAYKVKVNSNLAKIVNPEYWQLSYYKEYDGIEKIYQETDDIPLYLVLKNNEIITYNVVNGIITNKITHYYYIDNNKLYESSQIITIKNLESIKKSNSIIVYDVLKSPDELILTTNISNNKQTVKKFSKIERSKIIDNYEKNS